MRPAMLGIMGMMGMNGSYNSFRNQVGFCKLQGFDTISRETSHGVDMFIDGRIHFGVGTRFQSTSDCGRCLHIQGVDNFAIFNHQLNGYEYGKQEKWRNTTNLIAMIFDQCLDPICEMGYLDFDIYSPLQPVRHGNPFHIDWEFIPCPILPEEKMEFLFCLSNTCAQENPRDRNLTQILHDAVSYYWTLFIRNNRLPVHHIYVPEYNVELQDNNGWVYNDVVFNFTGSFTIVVDHQHHVKIDLDDYTPSGAYHGGILISTTIQN
jgi:hypothetical protein